MVSESVRDPYVRERLGLPHLDSDAEKIASEKASAEFAVPPQTARSEQGAIGRLPPVTPPSGGAVSGFGSGQLRTVALPSLANARHVHGGAFGRDPRFRDPFLNNGVPGPGEYRPPAAVGPQPYSLRRNAPGPISFGPRAVSFSPRAERELALKAGRNRLRESRAKLSALLEQWQQAGEKQISAARLAEGLKFMRFSLTNDELTEIFAPYASGTSGTYEKAYELKDIYKALWSSKNIARRLMAGADADEAGADERGGGGQQAAGLNLQRVDAKALHSLRFQASSQIAASRPRGGNQTAIDFVREQLVTNGKRVMDIFNAMELPTGEVGPNDFHEALHLLGLPVSVETSDAIFFSWDTNGNGSLDLVELNGTLRRGGRPSQRSSLWRETPVDATLATKPKPGGGWKAMESHAAKQLQPEQEDLLKMLGNHKDQVLQYFTKWDADENGLITRKEFRTGIEGMGVQVPRKYIDALFKTIDADGTGEITIDELQKALKWAFNNRKARLLCSVEFKEDADISMQEQLREALTRSVHRVIDLFQDWDDDGDGMICPKEFRQAISLLGMKCPGEEIDILFQSLDKDGHGQISFRELKNGLRGTAKETRKQVKRQEEVQVLALDSQFLRDEVKKAFEALA